MSSRLLSKNLKIKIYKTIIFPVVCCINRLTSLCKNLFNLLEFLAEAFRCTWHRKASAKNSSKLNKWSESINTTYYSARSRWTKQQETDLGIHGKCCVKLCSPFWWLWSMVEFASAWRFAAIYMWHLPEWSLWQSDEQSVCRDCMFVCSIAVHRSTPAAVGDCSLVCIWSRIRTNHQSLTTGEVGLCTTI